MLYVTLAVCAFALVAVVSLFGCAGIRQMMGASTSKEVAAARQKYDDAEKQVAEATTERDELQRAIDASKVKSDEIRAKNATLSALPAKVALELANADSDAARGFLEDQLASISRERKAITDRVAASAEAIAGYKSEFSRIAASVATASADLDARDEELTQMETRAKNAAQRATQSLSGIVRTVGGFVPGGAVVAGPVADAVNEYGGWLALAGMGATGAGFIRARRKSIEHKEESVKNETALKQLVVGLDAAQDPTENSPDAAKLLQEALAKSKGVIRSAMDTFAQEKVDAIRK